MPTFIVKTADPKVITFEKTDITLGAVKHPDFFKRVNGFRVPTLKVGEKFDIPQEAIATSDNGRQYVICDVSLEQLQKQEVRESIALKRKQSVALG